MLLLKLLEGASLVGTLSGIMPVAYVRVAQLPGEDDFSAVEHTREINGTGSLLGQRAAQGL